MYLPCSRSVNAIQGRVQARESPARGRFWYAVNMGNATDLTKILEEWKQRFPRRSQRARQALDDARHADPSGWGMCALPSWAVDSAWRLEALLDSGLGRSMNPDARQEMLRWLRIRALKSNAAVSIHESLLGAGAPRFTSKEVFKLLADAFDFAREQSVQALYADQPAAVVQTISVPPGIGALKAAIRDSQKPTTASLEVLEQLTRWGANWDLPSIEGWVYSLNPEERKNWDARRRRLEACRLGMTLPSSTPSSSRLRM